MEEIRHAAIEALRELTLTSTLLEFAIAVDAVHVYAESREQIFSQRFMEIFSELSNSIEDEGVDLNTLWATHTARRLEAILRAELTKREYLVAKASEEFLPRFQPSETERLQMLKLCSDIRKIVAASEDFDEPHRVRLFDRISAMETEIHKEKGLFDVILGGVSDFGEAVGKFGNDVKPLLDRIKELKSIARGTTPDYEQLSQDDLQRLPSPDE